MSKTPKIFGLIDYESIIEFLKFNMADKNTKFC